MFNVQCLDALLCQCVEVFLGNELQVVEDDGLTGLVRIVGAEHDDPLALQQEGVHVGDADTLVGEHL